MYKKAISYKNHNWTLIYSTLKYIYFLLGEIALFLRRMFLQSIGLRNNWLTNDIVELFPHLLLDVIKYSLILVCLNTGKNFIWEMHASDDSLNYIFLCLLEGADSRKQLLFNEHEDKSNFGKHSFQLWQTGADCRYRIKKLEQISLKKQLPSTIILQISSS